MLSPPQVSPALRRLHPGIATVFRDASLVEFFGLPDEHRESDLHRGLLNSLRRFLTDPVRAARG